MIKDGLPSVTVIAVLVCLTSRWAGSRISQSLICFSISATASGPKLDLHFTRVLWREAKWPGFRRVCAADGTREGDLTAVYCLLFGAIFSDSR